LYMFVESTLKMSGKRGKVSGKEARTSSKVGCSSRSSCLMLKPLFSAFRIGNNYSR
jgi:hypothetical protein